MEAPIVFQQRRSLGVQMLQKPMANHMSFLSTRSYNSRPLSEATEIFDTDYEAEYSPIDNSPRRSVESFGNDSATTLSTEDEAPTPDESDQGSFNFQFDKSKPVQGPSGPHLFRASLDSQFFEKSEDLELYFSLSPLAPHRSSRLLAHSPKRASPTSPEQFPYFERSRSSSLPDIAPVAGFDDVRSWTPTQVAEWMYESGFEDAIVERFIRNDISGSVLLDLQMEDLKELDISSFGIRHRLINLIQGFRTEPTNAPLAPAAAPDRTGSSQRLSRSTSVRRDNNSPECFSTDSEAPTRGSSRRWGRTNRGFADGDIISPAESVSIVAIEQLLPKLHACSKGENCSRFQKQQRKLARIATEFPDQFTRIDGTIIPNTGKESVTGSVVRPKSDAAPSVVASSDVLGPGQLPEFQLNAENLNGVQPRDPQENVRQFLSFQHVNNSTYHEPNPRMEIFPTLSPPESSQPALHMANNLRNLPKLMIPDDNGSDGILSGGQRTVTPSMGSRLAGSATATQEYNPYQYPLDMSRQTNTPFSEMDVPLTAFPIEPLDREASQSVPPNMVYGNHLRPPVDPISRSSSAKPDNHRRRPSFATMAPVDELQAMQPIDSPEDLPNTPRPNHTTDNHFRPSHFAGISPSAQSHKSDPDVSHSGWMKKRKTRLLRHEWQDAHFTLRGTVLAMHKDERDAQRRSRALEFIDVDDYAVACSSLATNSKLTAAFKRSVLRKAANLPMNSDETAFAFSLIPANDATVERKHLFTSQGKSHHFAVKTRDERINWMRELMLAKALKKGREEGGELTINGRNVI
ncbi:SAM and PH domain-containing protein [Blastomyces gilchristii SLH14081]|uniref:SAM and PH domain-containing protein n=1 Tax=Blastomyces gilchristii (strain SLH14081) TaxID=559298 RepID=A0A179UV04_BLAGS|nr:SAM and PH domain-containing protein [Blastomyces gilchristii SLH14081]OAT11874.1 SAM and PH domain-containing protein [Blastomyces gilchristii SLH14081]